MKPNKSPFDSLILNVIILVICSALLIVFVRGFNPAGTGTSWIVWLYCGVICAAISIALTRISGNNRYYYALGFAIVVALVFLAIKWMGPMDMDEMEHLHVAWLISQGKVLYRNIWQNHTPPIFLLLSPFVGRLPHNGSVCDFARISSVILTLSAWGLAVMLAMKVHRPSRGLVPVMLLLMAGCLTPGRFILLRPDPIADLCTMGAIVLLLWPLDLKRVFLSGALLGLSIAFTPKHLVFLPLFFLVLVVDKVRLAEKAKSISIHYLGVAIGIVPWMIWLSAHGLLADFKYWVFEFNRGKVVFGGYIPGIFKVFFLIWVAQKLIVSRDITAYRNRLLLVAIALSPFILWLYSADGKFLYQLQMLMILTSVAVSGPIRDVFASCASNKKSWAATILVSSLLMNLLLTSFMSPVANYFRFSTYDYLYNRKEIDVLSKIAEGKSVVCITGRQHPIFADDATDLYLGWQYDFWLKVKPIADRMRNIDGEIESKSPAIIISEIRLVGGRPYPGEDSLTRLLVHEKVLNEGRGRQLQNYIETHYTPVQIVRHCYWIRNDLVDQTRVAIHIYPR